MVQATFHFPPGFLWGTATSSHQVEGFNTNNNWWAWEGEPGRIIHGQKSGAACDWWGGRWREDFDRAERAGRTPTGFPSNGAGCSPCQASGTNPPWTAIGRWRAACTSEG